MPDEESGTALKINGEYVWAIRPVIEIEDNKMNDAKVKSYLAQEFRDLKARLSKKSFNDQKSKWIAGLATIKDALKKFKDEMVVERFANNDCAVELIKTDSGKYKYRVSKGSKSKESGTVYNTILEAADEAKNTAKNFNDSAEYINDRKIDIKKDGKLIDTVNAETLDEAVKIYERQHPELRGQIDAYFSDEAIKDIKTVTKEEWESAKKHGYTSIINGKKYMLMADPKSGTVLAPVEVKDADIHDSLSEKAKQLISKAVAEARFDYKTAMDFAVADLKAEKEWAWTNQNEVSQMVQRLIKNRMDF